MATTNNIIPTYIHDIVDARRRKGYNQKQFADVLGITNSRMNGLERGRINISAKMLAKICDELDLTIRLERNIG